MILNGFKENENDKCVYSDNNICAIIRLYVDHLLIFDSNIAVNSVKSFLSKKIDMKDLGEVKVILGIKITMLKRECSWINFTMFTRS